MSEAEHPPSGEPPRHRPLPVPPARSLLRDYLALSLGELVAKAAGLLAFAWLARVLGPASYGAVELAVALAMIFGLVVDFGLGPIGARDITRQRQRAPTLARQIPGARLMLALPATAGMAVCILLLDLPAEPRRLGMLFALALLGLPWTLNWLLQGLGRMRWIAPAQPLRMLAFGAGVALFVGGPHDLWRVGAAEIASVAVMAGFYVVAARRGGVWPGLAVSASGLPRLLGEALPVATSQLLWALNQQLPTLLVAAVVGGAELAFFGGANRIVLSLGAFVWLYFFNLYPSIVRATEGARFAEQSRVSFRATSWLGIGGALLCSLLAGPLCRLAYGDAFEAAGAAFAILAWSLPLSLLSGHARFGLIGSGHQRRELGAQAAGVLVTLGLGLPLVSRFGGIGAAVTAVASAVVVWAMAHGLARGVIGSLPFGGAAVRPALAAASAAALFFALPLASPWLRAGAAAALYFGAAPLLEPRLMGDVRRLLRPSPGAAPEGQDG